MARHWSRGMFQMLNELFKKESCCNYLLFPQDNWSICLYPKTILIHFNVICRSVVKLEIVARAEAIMPKYRLWNVARIDLYPPAWLHMNNGQMLDDTFTLPMVSALLTSGSYWLFFGLCHNENWKKV